MSTQSPAPDEPDDDEALRWAGDDARGQNAPRLRGASDPAIASGAAESTAAAVPSRGAGETILLVATGVFAGLYLALTVGWVLSVQLLASPYLDVFGEVMWQFGEFLAMIAAVLWFGAALLLTPVGTPRRALRRLGWMAIGVLVLLPWPFLLGAFS